MKHKQARIRRLLASLMVLSLVAAGCAQDDDPAPAADPTSGGSSTGDSSDPGDAGDSTAADPSLESVKIGYNSQVEGFFAAPEAAAGAQAIVNYVNAELGGVDGHPVELVLCTSGDEPEGAIACAQEFVNDDEVQIVVTDSFFTLEMAGVMGTNELSLLALAGTELDWQTPFEWSLDGGFFGLVQAPLIFAVEELGAETISFITLDDPFYQAGNEVGQELAEELGLEIVGSVPASFEEADYTGIATLSNAADADVVMAAIDPSQCPAMAAAFDTLGIDTPVMIYDNCALPDTMIGGGLDGWYTFGNSVLPADAGSASTAVLEGQQILETYGSAEASPFGLAGFAMASTLAAHGALVDVGFDNLERGLVDAAMATQSSNLGWYVPTDCAAATEEFPGACVQEMVVMQVEGEILVERGIVPIDLPAIAALLGG